MSIPKTIRDCKYRIERYGGTHVLYDVNKVSLLSVAEACAEDLHNNHNGHECVWPLMFIILDLNDNVLGRFSVEREVVPEFRAEAL